MTKTQTLPEKSGNKQRISRRSTPVAMGLALIGALTLSSCGSSPGGSSPEAVSTKALQAVESGDWETYGSCLLEHRKNKLIAKVIGFAAMSSMADEEKGDRLEALLKSHNATDPDSVEGDEKPKGFAEAADFIVSKVSNSNALLNDLIKFSYEVSDADKVEKAYTFTLPRKGGELADIKTDGDKATALVKYEKGGNLRAVLKKENSVWFIEFFERAP